MTTDYISLPVDSTDSASVICARAEKTANSRGQRVRFMIAGIPMECGPGAEADELFSTWWLRFKENQKAS